MYTCNNEIIGYNNFEDYYQRIQIFPKSLLCVFLLEMSLIN